MQADFKNADDHLFLRSACQRFGVWFSRPGNGVSHPCHQENFGKPGKTLLGADSHTPAGGALGMLAIGAGGLEVALAMAGEPFFTPMPQVWGVKLTGRLPDWVSAKDVILEMLRRHGVESGVGKIVEYYGPGLDTLSAMDRHVIANMGAELGATTTVFPSDQEVRRFLRAWQREDDWVELLPIRTRSTTSMTRSIFRLGAPDRHAIQPGECETGAGSRWRADLSSLRRFVGQSWLSRLRCFGDDGAWSTRERSRFVRRQPDIPRAARNAGARRSHRQPPSRRRPAAPGRLQRLHRHGPGTGDADASLRTVPRNFPGRSGTREDKVCLVSPETATASALTGVITDPRSLSVHYPALREPATISVHLDMFVPPASREERVAIEKGPNIKDLGSFDPLPPTVRGPVLIKVGIDPALG